ncbi:valine--tRNA ligase [Thalassoglobus polymorphus]|uniref:Valine--tRNA ligase n=1 Tax=Thalassoglobus polymorphus TaxID=2527994 RepID=A0A517QIU5_9PLAN|nr:valine--tRNA ligase [Thalassoglobus polymorphus]QDT31528.1 Valine--tRNA ligase [Thalassoglobus polymorphus]
MTDIPKLYDPQEAQAKWFPFWEQRGDFNADPVPGKESHTIMIPLPNVTGALHMGHALNGTCQDLITRWRRMQGFEALWMPGTDHAGIATQAVVERRMLEEEGLTRHDIGREALVNRIWRWKDAYEKRIISQQKSLGASCDWRRIRFTLDDVCAKAVRRTFFKMFSDGLIFRGKRLVNWDVQLQTAVADDEVFEEDVAGHFWTFNYPVVDEDGKPTGERIRYATTRPETMLGDTAVCVHPTDERYTKLVGKSVKIPLNNRIIPIIADALLADKEKGTGAVKVTPAHDPNDYACYLRNPEIGIINILNADGTLNENGGEWEGIDRLEVRGKVVERMAELGRFEGVEDRTIPLKHSDRSKTPVEPFLSDQWFVRMGDDEDGTPGLAQKAVDAVEDGRVRFFPSRYAKTYTEWLGEKRDWCISRQLWWGHRIPVWTAKAEQQQMEEILKNIGCESIDLNELNAELSTKSIREGMLVQLEQGDGEELICRICIDADVPETESLLESAGFEQDPDVLDTWFSSALWPHATLGWPDLDHNPPLNEEEVLSQTQLNETQLAPGEQPEELVASDQLVQGESAGENTGNEVLSYFYPGSVLITSRDIITLWVARMVLTGLYNMDDVPFQHVHVHPKILDGFGQTMSKSKGNGVDPVDLIEKYGADAIRFTIASFAGETQDVRLPISYECPHCEEMIAPKQYKLDTSTIVVPSTMKGEFPIPQGAPKPTLVCSNKKCKKESQFTTPLYDADPDEPIAKMVSERFEYGRNFCNKFWNAARFAMMNLVESDNGPGYTAGEVTEDQLQLEDRWILSRLSTVANQIDEFLSRYQFDAATRAIRDFTWNEFCDWYLEMIKPRLRDAESRATAQRILLAVLDSLVRLLQPFTPFICEELWNRLNEIATDRALPVNDVTPENSPKAILSTQTVEDSCINASWPKLPSAWQDDALEKRFERLQETIVAIRNVRAIYSIPPGTSVKLLMRASAEVAGDMQSVAAQFDNLTKAVLEAAGAEVERPNGSASFSLGDADGYIPLEGLIDTAEELERQKKKLAEVEKHIKGSEAKLNNEKFVNSAPEAVVNGVRETLANNQSQKASIEEIIRDLS